VIGQRLEFRAMGGDMLAILDGAADPTQNPLGRVPEWFEDWEQSLSRFRSDSELSRLNRTFDQPVPVSSTLWQVFELALLAEKFSGGLLTPTVLDALVEAGYDRDIEEVRRTACDTIPGRSSRVDPLSIVLFDEPARTICLPRGLRLDFGGVAKGWAAQQAMQRLSRAGAVLVDAAGDIALSGPRLDGSPWTIGVADPLHPGQDLLELQLDGGGVATSGKDRRRWQRGSRWQHHLINPLTAQPAQTDLLTATVIAPTVTEAEMAAKTAFLLGSLHGMQWIEANPHLAALLILEDGQALSSSRLQPYLH
jgi:thiamine biosynthesis lipoprotein